MTPRAFCYAVTLSTELCPQPVECGLTRREESREQGVEWVREGHSRGLEEEDPPVSCAQVEDVWPLAVIAGSGG